MKKLILLAIIFIIYTVLVRFCPAITSWDESLIVYIQKLLKDLPLIIPLLPDCKLYVCMIFLPMICIYIWSFRIRKWQPVFLITIAPIVAYAIKFVVKPIIARPRPPFELQPIIHPDSFSYVSTHSLVTISIWGLVIYFLYKYCDNKFLKYFGIVISVLWILFVGLSRVWLGVHYPTDVLGAYLLGFILLTIYSKIRI